MTLIQRTLAGLAALLIATPCLAQGVDPVARALGAGAISSAKTRSFKVLTPVLRPIGQNNVWVEDGAEATIGTEFQSTSRQVFSTIGPVTKLSLTLINKTPAAGNEHQGFNSVIRNACVEYPLGVTNACFAIGGATTWTESPTGAYTQTDNLGVFIPPASQFAIRTFTGVPSPPTSVSASAVAGGSLTSGTTYYYEVDYYVLGIRSYHSAEVSVTPSGSNLSAYLTWTKPIMQSAISQSGVIDIYRHTSSGGEQFIASTPDTATGFVDTGALQEASGSVPSSIQLGYVLTKNCLRSNWVTNTSVAGGNQANVSATTGTFAGTMGVAYASSTGPVIVLGDDATASPVVGLGDSIEAGVGIEASSCAYAGNAQSVSNWFDAAMATDGLSSINVSLAGTKIQTIAGDLYPLGMRLYAAQSGAYVISDLAINDLAAGSTWQQIATWHNQVAQAYYNRGARYVVTTALPQVTTTDGGLTITHQSQGAYEAQRESYNTWVRNGLQFSGSTPVLAGGTPSPFIYSAFDLASAIGEVSSSGVPTPNGGYWPVPLTSSLTGNFTGTPTTTSLSSASTLTNSQWAGEVIKVTSGAASGQVAALHGNTTNSFNAYATGGTISTGLTVPYGLSTSPASGDTWALYNTFTQDGTHPTLTGHQTIAAVFATWAAANLGPFQ